MRFECYGTTRPRTPGANEDAFGIAGGTIPAAVVCDGAGRAAGCAGAVVRQFLQQVEGSLLQLDRFPAWKRWLTWMDASMAGGPQTTFVGVAGIDDRLVGACAGDSRGWLVNEHGCHVLTPDRTPRLGSGHANPTPIHTALAPRDVVVLLSDGAWGTLSASDIREIVLAHTLRHLADLPAALLDRAERTGRSDDMTAVALRALR